MSCKFHRQKPRLYRNDVPYGVLMCVGQALEREYEMKKLPVLKWKKKAQQ